MREIVIGDVHGCLEELDELLRTVQCRASDRLVLAGDLVDRGPDSVGVVRRVMELDAECCLGNHDDWYVRLNHHLTEEFLTGAPNPLRPEKNRARWAIYKQLPSDAIQWLKTRPLWVRLDERTVVVHAGMRAGVPLVAQDRDDLLHLRYVDRLTGKRWSPKDKRLLTPDVAAYWTELWTGPEEVVYGHHPSKTNTIVTESFNEKYGRIRCWGIDTGCCFGNKLTAWIRTGPEIELVSVPARQQYAPWHGFTHE